MSRVGDLTWSLPFQLVHRAEFMPAGHSLPPLGSHEPPLGPLLNQWTWRQGVLSMAGASEFTSLKVCHAPK
ncbi:hypothetical protein [Deinococcus koreensis]|uniref:Uncharacterized protein n=1 Tax=Deinococcus koreensis TaxID=2054903 RepID=A0A2K3UXG2_9DEIO|nr:hypothetical protein [Deinococcus koreensis]PNY81220.1 hypothetical protein CVO96_07345 [Deinococcus koreensis]